MAKTAEFGSQENIDRMMDTTRIGQVARGIMGADWYRSLDTAGSVTKLEGILRDRRSSLKEAAFDEHGSPRSRVDILQLVDQIEAISTIFSYRSKDAVGVRNNTHLLEDHVEKQQIEGARVHAGLYMGGRSGS